MRIHRFYVTEQNLNTKAPVVITNEPLVNQLKNVFRFVKDDRIILFNNSGFDFLFSIDVFNNDSVSLNLVEARENVVLPTRETYLFASIVKKDNFEWIAQKATELGVSHIIPIASERSEKKDLNTDRINKIIIEAAEQSGRGTLPILYAVTDLKTAITNYGHVKSIAWDPTVVKFVPRDVMDCNGAYIGPEGGWSAQEFDLFKEHGIHVRSLGPQILRSETAVIAVISQLVF
jgi:16S rRNA (uracil1498-N3)-methyltransferase